MCIELVLLSEAPPTFELQLFVLGAMFGEGSVNQWTNGAFATMFSEAGEELIRVHNPKLIQDATEARAAIYDPPEAFSWWTDLIVPDAQELVGVALATALANETKGALKIRK